jgi:hypothetical protein
MSPTLFEKVKGAAAPTEGEIALGAEPIAVYDPVKGSSFLLKTKIGSNGFITYEDSKFADKVDGIYATEAEADADIKANGFVLDEFLKEESFMSYEDLKAKLAWFDGVPAPTEVPEVKAPEALAAKAPEAPKVEEKKEAPKAEIKDDEIDSLLDDLLG